MGTTEGVEVDLLAALLELAGWESNVKAKEEELSWCCLIKFVEPVM